MFDETRSFEIFRWSRVMKLAADGKFPDDDFYKLNAFIQPF